MLSQYGTPEQITNGRASEYNISIVIPFAVVTLCKPYKNEPVNEHAMVNNTCTPV
jgi:hypothetical protein